MSEKKGFLKEFRDFAMRGNVIDMAIGVVLGTAFGKITATLVGSILMPLIGYCFGGLDFSGLDLVLRPAVVENGVETAALVIGFGAFITTIVDFLLIALSVFVMIKLVNGARVRAEARFKKSAEVADSAPTPPEPTREELLLTEIRDLLKENKHGG